MALFPSYIESSKHNILYFRIRIPKKFAERVWSILCPQIDENQVQTAGDHT